MSAPPRAVLEKEFDPPFVMAPSPAQRAAPVVLCSPHSGRHYPRHFMAQSRLSASGLRKSEDCYVDDLFAGVAALGVPMIAARFPRAFLDVNREPYELDPDLFLEPLPDYANTKSMRVLGGLGTIARIVADGEEIYPCRLPVQDAYDRIDCLYFPFHAAVQGLLESTHRACGMAILIDCHSMPSTPSSRNPEQRPDIVLGDRFGTACDGRLTHCFEHAFRKAGYEVFLNRPYAGGYITENYGRPLENRHALQVEINRGLYLDETHFTPATGYEVLRQDLVRIFSGVFAELADLLDSRIAAE